MSRAITMFPLVVEVCDSSTGMLHAHHKKIHVNVPNEISSRLSEVALTDCISSLEYKDAAQ